MAEIDVHKLSLDASQYFRDLQRRICTGLEQLEHTAGGSSRFQEDAWEHQSGGGGVSRVLVEGTIFEKAGVNFSRVSGRFSDELAATMPGQGTAFTATGISLVLHPRNPHVPAVHANFRCIVKGDSDTGTAWFGGGTDLTPYYPRREDVIQFHRTWKATCTRHSGVADYARFKKWCDDYFYLPHRRECRGVGGIFFDYLTDRLDDVFAFVRDAGDQFLNVYVPIVQRRVTQPWTDDQRRWQLIRRGRYVEFNLLYDRGTMFGLKTGGRVESILMSLPPHVMWGYNESAMPGSAEAQLFEYLQPRNWADEQP
jgi:coproporphyrinogen III oxidase